MATDAATRIHFFRQYGVITVFRYAFFITLAAGSLILTGCGSGLVPVSGLVTLDGKPVEGATVTFITEDGTQSASGQTDASGNFTLSDAGKPGVRPGTYKVLVTKSKGAEAPGEGADPNDMAKAMKKAADEDAKAAKAAKAKAGKPAGSDMMSKMKSSAPVSGGSGGGSAREFKSMLPTIYASSSSTPISIKVPPDAQPVAIELKSK